MKTLIIVVILFVLSGCSEQPVNPVQQPPVSKASAGAGQDKDSAASTAGTEMTADARLEYTYMPAGRRDPFKSLILGLKEKKVAGLTPLQLRGLSELKVIGIMWDGKAYTAMIETPDGKGYLIKEGVLVGPEGGVVTRISADAVTIEEKFSDIYGRKQTKKTVLGLRPKEEAVDEDI
ncbi:MAG: pilus assembly protein PilP [Nitrospirae bacterium]|nr:pilus assembly protein PilP [Nitrospirota bacterium]